MVKNASRFGGATSGELSDIHRIATNILHVIGEEHHICSVHESSTSQVHP